MASGHGTVAADCTVYGELVVDAASIDTANDKRDAHLRSAHFLDMDNHPAITYRVRAISSIGNGQVCVHGTLTVRGTSGPLPLTATATATTRLNPQHTGLAPGRAAPGLAPLRARQRTSTARSDGIKIRRKIASAVNLVQSAALLSLWRERKGV